MEVGGEKPWEKAAAADDKAAQAEGRPPVRSPPSLAHVTAERLAVRVFRRVLCARARERRAGGGGGEDDGKIKRARKDAAAAVVLYSTHRQRESFSPAVSTVAGNSRKLGREDGNGRGKKEA